MDDNEDLKEKEKGKEDHGLTITTTIILAQQQQQQYGKDSGSHQTQAANACHKPMVGGMMWLMDPSYIQHHVCKPVGVLYKFIEIVQMYNPETDGLQRRPLTTKSGMPCCKSYMQPQPFIFVQPCFLT